MSVCRSKVGIEPTPAPAATVWQARNDVPSVPTTDVDLLRTTTREPAGAEERRPPDRTMAAAAITTVTVTMVMGADIMARANDRTTSTTHDGSKHRPARTERPPAREEKQEELRLTTVWGGTSGP